MSDQLENFGNVLIARRSDIHHISLLDRDNPDLMKVTVTFTDGSKSEWGGTHAGLVNRIYDHLKVCFPTAALPSTESLAEQHDPNTKGIQKYDQEGGKG